MIDPLKPERHTDASNRVFMGWLASHGINAKEWVEKKPVTNEELEELLEEID